MLAALSAAAASDHSVDMTVPQHFLQATFSKVIHTKFDFGQVLKMIWNRRFWEASTQAYRQCPKFVRSFEARLDEQRYCTSAFFLSTERCDPTFFGTPNIDGAKDSLETQRRNFR